MCGRYLSKNERALEREIFLNITRWPRWEGSFNIAPTQLAPVVISTPDGYVCELMRFGLVPYAARGQVPSYNTINARVEQLQTGACWRGPWQRRQRCLVLASGFYEWHVLNDGKRKQPYLVRPVDQDSFAFAGLWDTSTAPDGAITRSFAIVTLPASPLMAWVHNAKRREPALLEREDGERWLSGSSELARAVIKPYPDDRLLAHPVSARVSSPEANDPELARETAATAEPPEFPHQSDLFR
jgi:putative SOS response-associated peptidase YedK